MKTITITIRLGKKNAINQAKRDILREALRLAGGNITHAARLLGSPRQVVQRQVRVLKRPATVRKGFMRAVDKAVDRVRRNWGFKKRSK